jgi:hypothetical protein
VSSAHENMQDVDQTFFALAWSVRREAAVTALVQKDLTRDIISYVRDSSGRVRFQALSEAMKQKGHVPDDTADVVSAMEQNGEIEPGGGGWVSLPR